MRHENAIWVRTLVSPRANADTERLHLVIAVDLTRSVDVKGPDGRTDFEKNLDAVGKVLAEVPANATLTIIGITDASFAQPYILMSAKVPADSGYFGERLRAARNELVSTWKRRSGRLEPRFVRTDIIGALILAGQIFDQTAGDKVLVIFSDMRNSTTDLNLESQSLLTRRTSLLKRTLPGQIYIQGVQVYGLGVDGSGKGVSYWQRLRKFWMEYFRSVGADLQRFSAWKQVPGEPSP